MNERMRLMTVSSSRNDNENDKFRDVTMKQTNPSITLFENSIDYRGRYKNQSHIAM